MKISELAKRAKINPHTLRYYEKQGLFRPSLRTANNYRDYSEDDLLTALFIKRCKESGFSLDDTAKLLAIKDDKRQHICAEAKNITTHKIHQITEQIKQLQHMQSTLKDLAQYCCGGNESAEFCSIISGLEGQS
jgi:MerR family Zn(II)-responsive transcriptional regulator of zntA